MRGGGAADPTTSRLGQEGLLTLEPPPHDAGHEFVGLAVPCPQRLLPGSDPVGLAVRAVAARVLSHGGGDVGKRLASPAFRDG